MDYFKETSVNLHRWSSYWYQISLLSNIVNTLGEGKKINVLEIGVEKKITNVCLTWLFETYGADVAISTLDINSNLKPDVVGDVRILPFKSHSFDIILAFEVLEHLPFANAVSSLKEIKRVTKNYIVLSLPHASVEFSLAVKLPRIPLKKHFFHFCDFPLPWRGNGVHCWEIGVSGYPLRKIKSVFKELNLTIINEFRNPMFAYHHFFVLRINK